jgi:tetratricopeptide (TPR) repeat protein
MQATFGICAPVEVYPRFLGAHNRAVEQGGLTPELRCNRAHGLHMFEHRLDEAEQEFQRALAEKPSFATVHVRMALMCATLGQLDRALELVTQGYQADPLLPTLPPAEVNVRVWRREYDKAIVIGSKAIELHPYLPISRANYAQALEFSGRLPDALEQYQLGSLMSGDLPWMRALEGTCLAKLGRMSDARAILDELEHRRETEYADALYVAVLRDALGERTEAFKEIERAYEENSAFLYSIDVDPKMDTFRDDARFTQLQSSLKTKECKK